MVRLYFSSGKAIIRRKKSSFSCSASSFIAIRILYPIVFYSGASAQSGSFNENVLKMMANNCKRPIIFALSNPTDKAECTAEAAYTHTDVSYSLIFIL